jgi:hypothetical protein
MTYLDRDLNDSNLMASASTAAMTKTARPGTRLGLFKRLAAVIALTLTLGTMLLTMTASPAAARPNYVYAYAGMCSNQGGDASIYYYHNSGTYSVYCSFDDGGGDWWTEP